MATTNSRSSLRSSHRKKSHSRDRKHQRKKSSSKESDHDSKYANKCKTLAQLAKLVYNGKLQIPCSLVEFVDDHASLIDQVFTILTEEDIEGMLPDVLKGLKQKKIKHLCYLQLSRMSANDIQRILTEDASSTATVENVPGEEIHDPIIDNVSDDSMEVESAVETVEKVNEEEDHIEVNVSCTDISPRISAGEESDCYDNIAKPTIISDIVDHTTGEKSLFPIEIVEEKRWHVDIPEEARLLEMRFREKLLEAQVKRLSKIGEVNQRNNDQDSSCMVPDCDGPQSEDSDENESSNRNESDSEQDESEPGELAELDLRQRALESLLNRRKEKLKSTISK